jgi:vancomycin resistance protein YoaR
VKLFFYVQVPLLSVILLSGCGTSVQNGGQDYSVQTPGASGAEISYALDQARQQGAAGDSAGIAPEKKTAKNVWLGWENIGGLSERELAKKLSAIAAKTDKAAVNAAYNTKTWAVKKEKPGKRLDVEKMLRTALTAGPGTRISRFYLPVPPEVTAEQLKKQIRPIAEYTTPFLDRSRSRIHNIRRTALKLDKTIVPPGREFSFNDTTGSKSLRNGYKKATVIVRTPKGPVHKKAPGGGVCQVSTTLYNAVLQCGLKVTERHEHSDDVYYVPDGKDATVTYGGADFKFVNTRRSPVMIRVSVGRKALTVQIYENAAIG